MMHTWLKAQFLKPTPKPPYDFFARIFISLNKSKTVFTRLYLSKIFAINSLSLESNPIQLQNILVSLYAAD
jgi:hypothetical protein